MSEHPSVGRIVWFYRTVKGVGEVGPSPAIVAEVVAADPEHACISVHVFEADGTTRFEQGVRGGDIAIGDAVRWEWPRRGD